MPERSNEISLRYDGDVRPSALEARELIQILSGLSSIAVKASRSYYGSTTRTTFRISHVKPGSIDVQAAIELVAGLQPAFALLPSLSLDVKDIPHLLKAWLDLLKFLKGHPPQKVQNVSNGNAVQIENVTGDVQIVNGNIYNTLIFNDVGKDAAKLEVPARRGANKLTLLQGKRKLGTYSREDLAQFKPIRPVGRPIVSEIEAIVEVVSPVFEGESVWRFRYGQMRLTAKIDDEDYLEKVRRGDESFRHGDTLRVKLRTVQETIGNRIVTKHSIIKVLDREQPGRHRA